MRLSNQEKFNLVLEHLEQGFPLHELAQRYDYDVSNLKYFVGLYRIHGKDVFLNRGETTIYTREQKLNAIDRVNLYLEKGENSIQPTRARKHYLDYEERLDKIKIILLNNA